MWGLRIRLVCAYRERRRAVLVLSLSVGWGNQLVGVSQFDADAACKDSLHSSKCSTRNRPSVDLSKWAKPSLNRPRPRRPPSYSAVFSGGTSENPVACFLHSSFFHPANYLDPQRGRRTTTRTRTIKTEGDSLVGRLPRAGSGFHLCREFE
jgi:hypothetical protein